MRSVGFPFALLICAVLAASVAPGCSCGPDPGGDNDGGGGGGDGGGGGGDGGGGGGDAGLNACGNNEPSCTVVNVGPGGVTPAAFPLPSDVPAPTNVTANGVTTNPAGHIVLDASKASFDFLWIADDPNYGVGLISKVSTKAFATMPLYREVARYATVTCHSDRMRGSTEGAVLGMAPPANMCADGMNGCCAMDSTLAGTNGGKQPVQLLNNHPSRSAVDFNGDVWIANRAHGGAPNQQSVTKIANSITDCIERNGLAGIQTSSDVNSDGIINTDCDVNNIPDSASTVCAAGVAKEFWGLADECILFTTNFGSPGGFGRPLALGKGAIDVGPSDAWVGTYINSAFYRIDGRTGMIKATVPIPTQTGFAASNPYGAAIDQFGILWAPNIGTDVYYFDTNNTAMQGAVRNPTGHAFYGVALDGYSVPNGVGGQSLIQQVWFGDVSDPAAMRYRPRRDLGFAGLAMGTWAHFAFPAGSRGRGIGVDNRTPTSYAWVALDGQTDAIANSGAIGRIPTDLPDGSHTLTTSFPTGQEGTLGSGVAIDLDIWGINQNSASAVHFDVDANGNVMNATTPDLVPLVDNPRIGAGIQPNPYTYSDFTGFGLRNFTNPRGNYTFLMRGCPTAKTRWLKVVWDADTPLGTQVQVRARSTDDASMIGQAMYTGPYTASPADLAIAPGPLTPNPANFLQIEFDLSTMDRLLTPALRSFSVVYECVNNIG